MPGWFGRVKDKSLEFPDFGLLPHFLRFPYLAVHMTDTRTTAYTHGISTWLLTATLLFSTFILTGYTGNPQSDLPEATHTELVISPEYRGCTSTITLQKAIATGSPVVLIQPHAEWDNALCIYNQVLRSIFERASSDSTHYPMRYLLQTKTIPQSSDEDSFVTVSG